jgi:MMP endo-(1,4)-3-O-methyl-alpha-D-mannosidase
MNLNAYKKQVESAVDIDAITALIAKSQRENGEIPWNPGAKTDPWDHVEAAIGLSLGGYFQEAKQAYRWLAGMQLKDGSWYSSYINGIPEDRTRESNMSSYLAVGLLHYYLMTGDSVFLKTMWQTMCDGIAFALSLQTPNGEIYWAISPEDNVDKMALLTGASSIFMSLKCALYIANVLGHSKPQWQSALLKLGDAIKNKPYLFNITKSRFSMDWFYPILSGCITGVDAQQRIDAYWKKFVIRGQGVRCVSDEPWVTIAETSELSMALAAMGNMDLSRIVFNWISDRTFEDGSYWCGYTYPDIIVWPEDKITWSNAVVLMAADAIYQITPASHLFNHHFWNQTPFIQLPK